MIKNNIQYMVCSVSEKNNKTQLVLQIQRGSGIITPFKNVNLILYTVIFFIQRENSQIFFFI